MVQSQFSVSWDAYKSDICNGFSSLQQNGEFVDMTLAADGHFVKVHQVLMALVSPYIKELIASAPCQHPVIFLNNVSYKTLSSLLEYIYTGEVLIPSEGLSLFMETAKSLHIKGLEELNNSDMTLKMADNNTSQIADSSLCHVTGVKRLVLPSKRGVGEVSLPAAARKILVKRQKTSKPSIITGHPNIVDDSKDHDDYVDMLEDPVAQESDEDHKPADIPQTSITNTGNAKEVSSSNLQYSVSIRGSLQVILNRYIYNLHSTTHRTGLRRWRCVEYRNHRCMAFLVTKGNLVLNRANLHNHSFHDKKILQKIEKKAVFTALDDVENYKENEVKKLSDNEASVEQEEYTLDFTET